MCTNNCSRVGTFYTTARLFQGKKIESDRGPVSEIAPVPGYAGIPQVP